MNPSLPYHLYILRCSDGTYYTGITSEIERRIDEHNTSPKGAKYTRTRRPVTLVYHEICGDRSSALKREMAIKRLNRTQKMALIDTHRGDVG
jgi:putative endonuclease